MSWAQEANVLGPGNQWLGVYERSGSIPGMGVPSAEVSTFVAIQKVFGVEDT